MGVGWASRISGCCGAECRRGPCADETSHCCVRVYAVSRGQLLGAFGGAHHGFDESDAQAAFFQFEDAVDGAAGGRGDFVFEQRGMVAGFEHHLAGAVDRLRGELRGGVARQADLDAGFGERLDDDVDVGGAGGGEARDGVHVLFVDDDGAAHGFEDALREFHLLGLDEAAAAEARGACAERRWRVGHGADDGDLDAGGVFDGARFHRRRERDDGLLRW